MVWLEEYQLKLEEGEPFKKISLGVQWLFAEFFTIPFIFKQAYRY